MDKRKYLIYVLLGFFLNFSSFKIQANSAWLPEIGKYKIGFSNSKIDRTSKEFKEERAEKFTELEQRIDVLVNKLVLLEGVLVITKGELSRERLNYKIETLKDQIELLKLVLGVLNPYQQHQIYNAYIEYAPRNNMSFGIDSYIKEDVFANSNYTSTKYKSSTKSAAFFYKYKVFQNKNLVFSIQPKVIFDNNSHFKHEEVFHEISFLTGATKKLHNLEFFTQGAVTYGEGTTKSCRKKKHHTVEYSEGIKFPYGISVVKFTKYYERKNHGFAYSRNKYEQFSVAKKFQFGNLGNKNFTIQLGYFWEHSLKYPMYEISGTLLSLWSEL